MKAAKERLSVSVDAELVEAARAAVAEGRAATVSEWVSEALRRQGEHDRRMRALDEFLAAHEAEHGEITDEEMEVALRRARDRATRIRSRATAGESGRIRPGQGAA